MSGFFNIIKRIFLICTGMLPLAGITSLVLDIYHVSIVPAQEDFAEAASYVRKNFREGDIIRFEPSWGLSGASHFRNLPLDDTDKFDHDVLKIHKRLWIVAHMGADGILPDGYQYKPVEHQEIGKIDLYLYEIPFRGKPLYDFVMDLKGARVKRIYKDGKIEHCRDFRNDEWHCPTGSDWEYVGKLVRDMGDSSRKVIWAHPLFNQTKLVIEYPETMMGSELEVFYGFSQRAIETGEGSPVIFEIDVNNIPVMARILKVYEKGFFRYSYNTEQYKGKKIPVKFLIYTPHPRDRQICFSGRTLP